MNDSILEKAIRLLRRGNYDKTIKLLEPEVNRYHGVFTYYYVLAVSYLYAKIYNVAFTYFKLAKDIKMREPSVLLGLAVLFLRRGDTDRAIDLYLEVQDLDTRNKIAKNALKVIRKYSGTDYLTTWVESKKLTNLFPLPPSVPPSTMTRILVPTACVLSALILGSGLLIKFNILENPINNHSSQRVEREGFLASALNSEEKNDMLQDDSGFRYNLSQKEIIAMYEEARLRFNEHRDEVARRSLNKILESNASEAIKAKSRMLMSFMDVVPNFDSLKDRFEFVDVFNDPILYRNCYVIWRGMASNLEVMQESTTFDLMVGYDTRRILQGVVPVVFDFSVLVNTEQPLEILARVVPMSSERGHIKLEGVSLHQAGLRLVSK